MSPLTPLGFQCTCPPGWEGPFCELDVDDCQNGPCLNGGTCLDRLNDFHCICPRQFGGRRCEERIVERTPEKRTPNDE